MTKTNESKGNATMNATGMMPDQNSVIGIISKVTKGTGTVASALGVSATAILPAIMLFALFLPTLLAPLTPMLNTAFLGFVAYSVLKRTGKLPAQIAKGNKARAPHQG